MIQVMNSTEFKNFFFLKKNYLLLNHTITKINTHKIKRKPNTKIFFEDLNNLIEIKSKKTININSKSKKY